MGPKTDPDIIPEKIIHPADSSRPILLSIICLFAFVFFGVFSILCLIALFKSGWIAEVNHQYLLPGTSPGMPVVLLYSAGSALHLAAFWGILQIWRQKKQGFLIYSVSALVLSSYQLLSDQNSLLTTVIYIGLILLFSVFYRRLK